MDVIFVLARLSIPTTRGARSAWDIAGLIFLLFSLELGTDWVKFWLCFKFSELPASTLEIYQEVLMADILVCRCAQAGSAALGAPRGGSQLQAPFRGLHSFSHSLQRRLGFSGVPMTTILIFHLLMLARSPCTNVLRWPRVTVGCFAIGFFL